MYYNIKIKSNGSEFSLESNNKEVTQREMDMYFAYIFDVSEDFKSKIKKVEIKNENVKSIKEIENYINNNVAIQPIPTPAPTQVPSQIEISPVNQQVASSETPIQQINIQQNQTQEIQKEAPQQEIHQEFSEPQAPISQKLNIDMQAIARDYNLSQEQMQEMFNRYIGASTNPTSQNFTQENQDEFYTDENEFSATFEEEIKEDYEHQKEILEIEFEDTSEIQNKLSNSNYGYASTLIQPSEIVLEEIEEFDSIQTPQIQSTQIVEEIAQEITQEVSQAIIQEITQEVNQAISQEIKQEIAQEVFAQEITQSPIETQSYTSLTPEPVKQVYSEAPIVQNEIDELISMAQNKLNSFDSIKQNTYTQSETTAVEAPDMNYDTIDFDLSSSKFNNTESYSQKLAQEKEEYIKNKEEKLNDIFVQKEETPTQTNYTQENLNQHFENSIQHNEISAHGEVEIEMNNENSINLDNTQINLQQNYAQTPTELMHNEEPVHIEQQVEVPYTAQQHVQYTQPQIQPVQYTQPIEQTTQYTQSIEQPIQYAQPTEQFSETNQVQIQPIETTQPPTQQGSYTQDFKLYLNEFNCQTQAEKFLICAFYIKNILKQDNFTMKSINSKLFQATGMIADLGIVDDLVSKAYIRVIESQDSKKYCITPDGEGYFVQRFQG